MLDVGRVSQRLVEGEEARRFGDLAAVNLQLENPAQKAQSESHRRYRSSGTSENASSASSQRPSMTSG